MAATVLFSGGLDSAACAHFMRANGHDVAALFFDFGQSAKEPELRAAEALCRQLPIPLTKATFIAGRPFGVGEIVGRNAFFVFAALMAMGRDTSVIAIGIHSGTPYYDNSPHFLNSLGNLVSEHTDGRTTLAAPFISWTKQDIYDYCIASQIPVELCYSCEAGEVPPCGICLSCRDRRALHAS
jgi:7-cyano-7-deazaguanine synthase